MRIAVAGATGNIGSRTVSVLERDGHEVVRISRTHGVDLVSGEGLDAALTRAGHGRSRDLRVKQFVTVLCARIRARPGGGVGVDLATAGHPAPLIVRGDGRVEQAEVYGTAAGLVSGMRYGATALELHRGDTMVMFTDGIDEAWGAGGQYGMARLHALLPAYAGAAPEVVCEAVEQDVMEYLDGRPHDDMAMVAVTCVR